MNQFSELKILKNIETICKYKNGDSIYPIYAEIDMTNLCNHKCPLCISCEKDSSSLTKQEAIDYILQLKECGIKAISFTGGGEPLMNKNTVDIIEFANKNGIDTGLITNGSLITEKITDRLLLSCKWIRVSLDAYSDESFIKTHGVNEFPVVINNIRNLGKIKSDNKLDCIVGVGYLLNNDTLNGAEFIAKELQNTGIDYLQFRPFSNYKIIDKNVLPKKYETETYKILYSRVNTSTREYSYCHASNFITIIQADGNIPMCCNFRHRKDKYIGNIKNNSFKDIWLNNKRKKIIEQTDARMCMDNCRYDNNNKVLHFVVDKKIKHQNFL